MMDVDVVQDGKVQQPPDQLGGPLWARMAGFPFWPARRCDAFEEASMKTPKSTKVKQVCVLFLGTRCDKAWVLESSVSPFTPDNLQANFLMKKFKGDKDYRAAVVEAVRMIQHKGATVDESFLELLQTCHNVFPLVLDASECCVKCGGSIMSGQLMSCHVCDQRKLHWSCCPRQEEGAWMCDACCKMQNLPLGYLVPFETTESPVKDVSSLPNLSFLSTLTKPSKPTSSTLSNSKVPTNKNRESLLKKVTAGLKNGSEPQLTNSIYNNDALYASSASAKHNLIAMASPVPSKDPLQLHSNFSSPQDANVARAADVSGIDDECFVCGLGGQLVLCDFPLCTRAYHQICVARTFPESLDCTYVDSDTDLGRSSTDSIGGGGLVTSNSNSLTGTSDVWFCPCHTCIGCHALQCTVNKLATVDLPVRLLSQQLAAVQGSLKLGTSYSIGGDRARAVGKHAADADGSNQTTCGNAVDSACKPTVSLNRYALRQKPLRNCSNCPLAVCGDCETALGEGCGVLHLKRNTEALECVNCSSRDPRLKLARLLEKAWVKCANSRLALPFLHPLLPLPGPSIQPFDAVASEESAANMDVPVLVEGTVMNAVTGKSNSAEGETKAAISRVHSNTSINSATSMNSLKSDANNGQDYWTEHTVTSKKVIVSDASSASNNGTVSSTAERGKRRQSHIVTSQATATTSTSNGSTQSIKEAANGASAVEVDVSRGNKRRRGAINRNNEEPSCVDTATPLKPITSMPSVPIKDTSRPADLLGVLEKIHRVEYTAVREYYSDINSIRNALQSRIDSATLGTATTKNDSIIMAFDTVVDASYHYLTAKMLQIQKYESRIGDNAVLETASSTDVTNSTDVASGEGDRMRNSKSSCERTVTSKDTDVHYNAQSAPNAIESSSATIDHTNNPNNTPSATLPAANSDPNSISESTTTTTIAVSRPLRASRQKCNAMSSCNLSAAASTTMPTANVLRAMMRLWRVECTYAVPSMMIQNLLTSSHTLSSYTDTTNTNSDAYLTSVCILPRSLLSWRHFVENGAFPAQFRGQIDPYSVKEQIQQEERQFRSSTNAQYQVREMLYGCGDPEFAKYATNEMEAAHLMLGMTHSQQRESLSLFEGAPGIISHNSKHASYHNYNSSSSSSSSSNDHADGTYGEGLAADDSLLILDRLREVTQKAVQLEERLRQQHVAQRRALLHSDTDTVTIGQASIITELKLANDNLRWRLQQKQSVVLAQQSIISDLQAQLSECKKRQNGASHD